MIFAAGFGTRMGDLTRHRPKPLIEVAEQPLLDHALRLTQAVNLRRVVVNVHYHGDQIIDHLKDTNVRISDESDEILDTGGGLKLALPLLDGSPVFTLNSDAVWQDQTALRLLDEAWDPGRMDALLLCVPRRRAHGYTRDGDFTIEPDGTLTRSGDMVYTGAQIIKTSGLQSIHDRVFSLNVLWQDLAARGRLFGLEYPGLWSDVGHPDGIRAAEDMLGGDHV